jgi:hypothetical protein
MAKVIEASKGPLVFDRLVDKTGLRLIPGNISSGIPVSHHQEPYHLQAMREFGEKVNKNILQQQRFFSRPTENDINRHQEAKKLYSLNQDYYKVTQEVGQTDRALTRS